MSSRENIFHILQTDFKENIFLKSKLIILFFRIVNYLATKNTITKIIGIPLYIVYIVTIEWILGVEIPIKTKIGKGFTIYHGYGLVINGYSIIGDYCKVRQGVTIGNKLYKDGNTSSSPIIGNHVEFGANSIAIGPITIGDHAVIGAGAVVVTDIKENSVAVGVPAKIIG